MEEQAKEGRFPKGEDAIPCGKVIRGLEPSGEDTRRGVDYRREREFFSEDRKHRLYALAIGVEEARSTERRDIGGLHIGKRMRCSEVGST